MNILFVCTGNTCRSPMAAALLKKLCKDEDNFAVLSGAISTLEGQPASKNAVRAMAEVDIDIQNHRSANIHADLLSEADLVLTMTAAHKQAIIHFFGDDFELKTHALLDYVGLGGDVADPYGGDIEVYRSCRDQLQEAIALLYKKEKADDAF